MNPRPNTSKRNVTFDENDVFEDSAFAAKFQESTFNDSATGSASRTLNTTGNRSSLNISALCCDEEISGYDKLTGKTWIYPTNYSVRDYQYNIIKAALLKNTLVSLPTGLGKTFIAAVVMYNYFRWYPLGKIVFTAPTRPLVAQQIDACYNIVAIPPDDTIEMTGNMQANTRKLHWKNKRVFFATPQVIYNDIKSGICPSDKIRCLVIDEAHRARGNYAYGQIVGALNDLGLKTYRLLALSATPGSKVEDVVNVVKHLNIAHLELRTEDCIDVAPYSHSRRVSTVVIQLGPQLSQLRHQYVEILDCYARRLKQLNILPHNVGNLSKGRIVMLYKEFQTKERGARHPQHNYIMKDFTVLIALYHGLELLTKHGSRVFLNFFDEHPEKSWIQSDDSLTMLLERLRDDLGVNPLSLDRSILPDGTIPEMPKDLCFGHPKFDKLREIMMDHFTRAKDKKQDTRAIVFCEYRESVNLVHCLLLQCRPLIIAQMFVGQGASGKDGKAMVSQKQQLRVMRSFREGACNVLVATCVAEEGLDVGSVDLIVCFDISTRSPVRLVQRCGRTGRERGGQVHILVTEGKEHQTLLDCMRQRDGLNKKILQSVEVKNNLYKHNPRMMPHGLTPECQKMFITVEKKIDPKEAKANRSSKGQKDLRNMLMGRASSSGSNSSIREPEAYHISKAEFDELFPEGFKVDPYYNATKEYWCMNRATLEKAASSEDHHAKLSTWLEWQRNLQNKVNVGHSSDSEILTKLLQYSDAKRFDMPTATQIPTFNTQDLNTQVPVKATPVAPKVTKKKQKAPILKPTNKNDGDIRALFSTATKSTKNYTKLINDLGIQNDGSIPTSLIDLLVDFTLESTTKSNKCSICSSLGDCSILKKLKRNSNSTKVQIFLKDPILPDLDLIDDIKQGSIAECMAKVATDSQFLNAVDEIIVSNKNASGNFDLEFDFDSPLEVEEQSKENLDKNFDIGDIEDIFDESSPEEVRKKSPPKSEIKIDPVRPPKIDKVVSIATKDEKESSNPKEALEFFGLDSIDDIFADSDNSCDKNTTHEPETKCLEIPLETQDNKKKESAVIEILDGVITVADNLKSPKLQQDITLTNASQFHKPMTIVRPLSPSILPSTPKVSEGPTSPILCSQRKFQLSTKKKKPNTSTPVVKNQQSHIRNLHESMFSSFKTPTQAKNLNATTNSINSSNNKSMFTITQLVEMINKNDESKRQSITKEDDQILSEILKEDDRSTSPILLTQAEKKSVANTSKSKKGTPNRGESLIILDSDSDDDDKTVVYSFGKDEQSIKLTQELNSPVRKISEEDLKSPVRIQSGDFRSPFRYLSKEVIDSPSLNISEEDFISPIPKPSEENVKSPIRKTSNEDFQSPIAFKRKFEEEPASSPYFNKRQKIDTNKCKPLSLQEKIMKALSANDMKLNKNDNDVNYMFESPMITSQKENRSPIKIENILNHKTTPGKSDSPFAKLQMFRRDKNRKINGFQKPETSKKTIDFDDSDDDFVTDKKYESQALTRDKPSSLVNHKIRKKPKKPNQFLDLEAELSQSSADSGDELSDESVGSIIDFICDDENVTGPDMYAHYAKSVKCVPNGQFKIPELPKRFNNEEIFSQFVEEDSYEMDSFCVDSHIGLTQANDLTELELAEQKLEKRRRARRKVQDFDDTCVDNGDSPIVKRVNKNAKRRISSDSE